ncbi:MAG: GTP-binding protein, partial [Gorillibacterium sp.]|nr:GTP-binding protein [Gorillibacterium sp.]
GKTTLIRKLITEASMHEKVVVLENEFGKVNIDGQVLKDSGVIVKELTSGCICCSLSGSFDESIIEIIDSFNPDRIIVEPTGIAMLSQVIRSCTSNKYADLIELNMVITVVDVKRFKLSYSYSKPFLENQIKATHCILLSKTEGMDHEGIQGVINQISEINNHALVIHLPWNTVTATELISVVKYKPVDKSLSNHAMVNRISVKHGPSIEACEIETESKFNKIKIEDIFSKFTETTEYGNIIRGKGVVSEDGLEGLKFDYVPEDLSFESFNSVALGKICLIGMNLNRAKIKELFI